MTWEAGAVLVRNPVIDNWDFDAVPVAWPGQSFDPPAKTGDRSNPAIWLDFDVDWAASDFLACGGSNARQVTGMIDCAILVEPITDGDLVHRQQADLLRDYYLTGSSDAIFFYVMNAVRTNVFLWDEAWMRSDWTCPFHWFRAA